MVISLVRVRLAPPPLSRERSPTVELIANLRHKLMREHHRPSRALLDPEYLDQLRRETAMTQMGFDLHSREIIFGMDLIPVHGMRGIYVD